MKGKDKIPTESVRVEVPTLDAVREHCIVSGITMQAFITIACLKQLRVLKEKP